MCVCARTSAMVYSFVRFFFLTKFFIIPKQLLLPAANNLLSRPLYYFKKLAFFSLYYISLQKSHFK